MILNAELVKLMSNEQLQTHVLTMQKNMELQNQLIASQNERIKNLEIQIADLECSMVSASAIASKVG